MKKIKLTYQVEAVLSVPDDFPINQLDYSANRNINDYNDGRHSFPSEMIRNGIVDTIKSSVNDAVFYYFCEKVEKHFGQEKSYYHLDGRNKLIDNYFSKIENNNYIRINNDFTVKVESLDRE